MKRLPLFFLVVLLVIAPGLGCRGGSKKAQDALLEEITLDWWRVFDGYDAVRPIVERYNELHPNVRINYRRLRFEEYEEALIRAFAEGRGPDIFSIHNTWIKEYQPLIEPLPKSIKVVFREERGTLKKEVVPVVKEVPTITLRKLEERFVEIVPQDVVRPYSPTPQEPAENRVWGLPTSLDTLALYYNRDLLNSAGIPTPPETWRDFQNTVKTLTRIDAQNRIVQAGAALGTADNVERASDILSVIMMQNGTQVANPSTGYASFAEVIPGQTGELPAASALRFYTDFANPIKEVYTWNNDQPNSFDAFTNGQTAFFFGYSYHVPLIEARNPKLNFSVAKLPQISGGRVVNAANYWVETVAKDSPHVDEAWDFIQFLTTNTENVTEHLERVRRPTALRELINTQIEDATLNAFVSQVLTAKSWYKGSDADAAEEAMLDLIRRVPTADRLDDELRRAQNLINQTI